MIKTISGSGRYLMVNGGMPATTYISSSPGAMQSGNMRFNTTNQCIEVYDGNSWIPMGTSHASIGLTPDAENAIAWAIDKLHEERMLELKAKDNPAIADLLAKKKTIEEQIKMIDILTKDHKVGTN